MRLPDWSKMSTGGAAMQHFASGGFCSAARSRGVSEPGRCTTQMRSYLSVAMPETCPSTQLFGSGFGQNGSTWNCGRVVGFWASAQLLNSIAAAAISDAVLIFMGALPSGSRGLCLGSRSEGSADGGGLHRLDGHHPRHRLDGAGDLRGDLEAAGQ